MIYPYVGTYVTYKLSGINWSLKHKTIHSQYRKQRLGEIPVREICVCGDTYLCVGNMDGHLTKTLFSFFSILFKGGGEISSL